MELAYVIVHFIAQALALSMIVAASYISTNAMANHYKLNSAPKAIVPGLIAGLISLLVGSWGFVITLIGSFAIFNLIKLIKK
jgi:hypothetical protein